MASPTPTIANKLSMFRDNMADFTFFMDTERDAIMKKMAHLIDYTKLILFVQGSAGVGKTSLLKHRFVHNKKENWRVAIIDGATTKHTKELLAKLAYDFRFSEQANNQLPIELIVQQLDELRKSDQIALLVVDNVERLDKSLCNLLAELAIRHQGLPALLRLVVFGQQLPKPLEQAVKQAALENQDEQINFITLPPLNEQETGDYIRHCLAHMGNSDTSLFDDATIHNIYQKSGGLIPRINDLANRVIGAPTKTPRRKGKNSVSAMPLIAATLVITILVSLFLFDQPTPPQSEEPEMSDGEQRVNSELSLPVLGGKQQPQRHSIRIKDGEVKSSFDELKPSADAPKPIAELQADPATLNEPEIPQSEKAPDITASKLIPESKTEKPKIEAKPESKQQIVVSEKKVEPKTKAVTQTSKGLTLEKLNQAPHNHYTLQLIAGSNENAVKRFISEHKLGNQAIYVPGTRNGKPWFTVIYGLYEGRSDAVQAAEKLPSSLKSKPWIRTVGGLQR